MSFSIMHLFTKDTVDDSFVGSLNLFPNLQPNLLQSLSRRGNMCNYLR